MNTLKLNTTTKEEARTANMSLCQVGVVEVIEDLELYYTFVLRLSIRNSISPPAKSHERWWQAYKNDNNN